MLCGHCVDICPSGAKKVRDDLGRAQLLVASGGAIASLAPSFVSEFPGVEPARLIAAIRALGFIAVSETARGADLVARQVSLALRDAKRRDDAAKPPGQLFISSAWPTVVVYMN